MTKLNEITDPFIHESKINYVTEVWVGWREARLQTLNRITNYLFVLNTGALLAALTYVATKSANQDIQTSIWLFSAGIFCSTAHATLDYYLTEISFAGYKQDVDALYGNKLEWEVFVERNKIAHHLTGYYIRLVGLVVQPFSLALCSDCAKYPVPNFLKRVLCELS